jgi:hypothetical protein
MSASFRKIAVNLPQETPFHKEIRLVDGLPIRIKPTTGRKSSHAGVAVGLAFRLKSARQSAIRELPIPTTILP